MQDLTDTGTATEANDLSASRFDECLQKQRDARAEISTTTA